MRISEKYLAVASSKNQVRLLNVRLPLPAALWCLQSLLEGRGEPRCASAARARC